MQKVEGKTITGVESQKTPGVRIAGETERFTRKKKKGKRSDIDTSRGKCRSKVSGDWEEGEKNL